MPAQRDAFKDGGRFEPGSTHTLCRGTPYGKRLRVAENSYDDQVVFQSEKPDGGWEDYARVAVDEARDATAPEVPLASNPNDPLQMIAILEGKLRAPLSELRTVTGAAAGAESTATCYVCHQRPNPKDLWGLDQQKITTAKLRDVRYWICASCFCAPAGTRAIEQPATSDLAIVMAETDGWTLVDTSTEDTDAAKLDVQLVTKEVDGKTYGVGRVALQLGGTKLDGVAVVAGDQKHVTTEEGAYLWLGLRGLNDAKAFVAEGLDAWDEQHEEDAADEAERDERAWKSRGAI
jgi:hypothetical protein